jgi:hypothetical protein
VTPTAGATREANDCAGTRGSTTISIFMGRSMRCVGLARKAGGGIGRRGEGRKRSNCQLAVQGREEQEEAKV